MKKILAMLLCVIMVVSMAAVVSAEEVTAAQVNDAAALAVGDQILLVNQAGTHAMGAQDGKKRVVVSVAAADGVVALADGVVVVTLEAGASDGTFALKVSDGYLYYDAGVGGNSIHTKAEKDAAASWIITIADGVASIMNAADNARFLQYNFNTNQERFVCYKGTQENVVIYKLGSDAPIAPPATEPTESAEFNWDMSKAEASGQWRGVQNKIVTDTSTVTVTEAGTTISYSSNNAWKGIRHDNAQIEIAKLQGKLSFTYSSALNVTHYRVYVLTDKGGDLAYNDEPTSGYVPANYYVAVKLADIASNDAWTAITNDDGSVTVTFDLNTLPFYKEGTVLKGLTIVTVTSKEIGDVTYKNISLQTKQEEPKPEEPTEPTEPVAPSVPEGVNAPVAGTTYNFGLYQAKTNKVLYVTGEVSTRYLSTTENVEEAASVYVEAVDGGYKFYILVDGVKNYITVYNNDEGKLSVKYDAAGTSVYAYNAECNNWVTNMEGADYYLGTYNTFDTISASKVSYIKPDNTGVSQFPANLYLAAVQEPVPSEPADPITPPTGDSFGVVVALLAISGTALVVLKKKEN